MAEAEAAEAEGLLLTEEAVRERVNLLHQNLADVRSLSLPGTYHEKITHLGNSLKNFVRLRSLDLSRNALKTLDGLQHLTYLEKLNLYFNRVSSLSEVFRLHTLSELKEVDLRLNPVVKNESDYRLFVVHMLPNLRRLDDRPVRDDERKASLSLFTTDQAYELRKPLAAPKGTEPGRSVPPRVEYVNSMSRKCSVLDEEDEAVLNLIAKCEWELSKPPGVTGSAKRDPEVELHNLSSICKMEDDTCRYRKSEKQPAPLQLWKQENVPKDGQSENKNMPKATETDEESRHLPVAHSALSHGHEKRKNGIKVKFLEDETLELPKRDPKLKFHDEAEAYERTTTPANFTSHPEVNEPPEMTTGHSQKGFLPDEQKPVNKVDKSQENKPAPMESLLDLVDKYWNGRKSLHSNKKFLSQAETILTQMQKSTPKDGVKLKQLPSTHLELNNQEKRAVLMHLSEQDEQNDVRIKCLQSELSSTKRDMALLKHHLDQLMEENLHLKASCSKAEHDPPSAESAHQAQLQITKLQNHNQMLTNESASLKQRLQHFDKMRELTEMLQESHRTLVSTNEHLLQELDEARSRHKDEVEQLHWSYNQLKKTMDKHPSGNMNNRC